ncbi:hypothetical protein [Thiolapillus sp.]
MEWVDCRNRYERQRPIRPNIGHQEPLDDRPIHPCPPFSDCNAFLDWSLEDGAPQQNLPNQRNSLCLAGETIDGTDRVFLIQLLRDARGVWKVEGM